MTEAQIWTVISLTGAVFLGFMAYVGTGVRDNSKILHQLSLKVERHDVQFERIDDRFEMIFQRFDGIDQRFDGIDQRLANIDSKLTEHDRRLDELKTLGEQLGRQFFMLAKKLEDHLRGHAS